MADGNNSTPDYPDGVPAPGDPETPSLPAQQGPDRRRFLRLGGGAAAVAALAATQACSGGDKKKTGFSKGGATTTPASSGPSGSTRPSASATVTERSGKIVIATLQDPDPAAKKALSDAYRKRQPGVEVVWDTKSWTSGQTYPEWLGTQVTASNIRPDIVSGNYLTAFRNYVNFDEWRNHANPYTGHSWSDDYDFAAYNETNSLGQRVLIGTQSVHAPWFYNVDIFSKVGVTPPKTWNALVDVCKKLKAAGHVPVSANYTFILPPWVGTVYFDEFNVDWAQSVRAQPGDWDFNPDLDGKFHFDAKDPFINAKYTVNNQRFFAALKSKKLRYDTPQMAEIMGNIAEVFPKYSNPDFFVNPDQYTPFLQQKAAMMIDGAWSIPTLLQDLASLTPARQKALKIKPGTIKPFKWDIFQNPPMGGPLAEGPVRAVEDVTGEYISVINKNAKQTDLVMDFCMFWISKPGYQPFVDAAVRAGTFAPGGNPLIYGVTYPEKLSRLFEKTKLTGSAATFVNVYWLQGQDVATSKDLSTMFQNCIEKKVSPTDYSKQLQGYIDKNIDRLVKAASLTPEDLANPARRPKNI